MIDEYIRQYGKRLYGLCHTLCLNPPDAEDLYQETWLKALRFFSRYDNKRPFEAWLTGICVNTYRDHLRRKRKSPLFDQFATNEEKDKTIEQCLTSPPPGEAGEDYEELHRAIDRLPEKMRTAVILYYFCDMDEAKTAASLGIPEGTVKSRLHHARNRLRKELEHESDLPF